MNRRSLLIGSTIVLASLVSMYLALQQKHRGVDAVVAARDLEIGTKLDKNALRVVSVPLSLAPSGIYHRKSDVVGRAVSLPLIKDELLLPRKLSERNANAQRFPPSMVVVAIPAVSIRANDVVIAGDGSLSSRLTTASILLAKSPSGVRNPEADEIWPGLVVFAVSARVELHAGGGARLVPVVTLMLMTMDHQAEYGHQLVLAGAQHRVWIALRGAADGRARCRSDATQRFSQSKNLPILVSHHEFQGCCRDSSTTDLQVFANGAVAYSEDSVGTNQRSLTLMSTHLTCPSQLDTDEVRELSKVLDSHGVRALPTKVLLYPRGRPIDSSSKHSFEINRVDGTQQIQVELSPLTQLPPISKPDPPALTQLDCEVEEITAKTVKSSVLPDGWVRSKCYEVLGQHFRPVIVGSNEALKLLSSGRYALQSVVLDGGGRAWFVLMEGGDTAVSTSADALNLLLQRAEFEERLKSDFGER